MLSSELGMGHSYSEYNIQIVEGSDNGLLNIVLLVFWAVSIIWFSKNLNTMY
jgi:hypothetical protein